MFLTCLFIPFANVYAEAIPIDGEIGGSVPTEKEKLDIDVTDYNRDDSFETNCEDLAKTLSIGGKLIFFAKIFLPLIIIVKATLDLSKIVISGSNSEIPKQAKKLGITLVAGILIFYIPTLINAMFSFISGFDDKRTEDSKICSACIFDVYGDLCKKYTK